VPTFADRGCLVVSVTDPYGRILRLLDWKSLVCFIVNMKTMFSFGINDIISPHVRVSISVPGNNFKVI
jgi:hypothetical protein